MSETFNTKDLLAEAYPIFLDGSAVFEQGRLNEGVQFPTTAWAFWEPSEGPGGPDRKIIIPDQQVKVEDNSEFQAVDSTNVIHHFQLNCFDGNMVRALSKVEVAASRYAGDFS